MKSLIASLTAGLFLFSIESAHSAPQFEVSSFDSQTSSSAEQATLVTSPPEYGTFFSVQLTNQPPWPQNPFPELDVYSFDNVFWYDDRSVDYVDWKEQNQGKKNFSGMASASEGPPAPGEGGGEEMTVELPPAYSLPGLKLTMPVITNSVMNFSLLESDTNWFYDVYWTPVIPTNRWRLLGQTVFESTNFSFPMLTNEMAFFRLGLITDSDGDGLPDAFEILVTGTSPSSADSNGNGISDANEDHDGNGIPNLAEYVRVTHAGVFASKPKAFEGGLYGEFTFFLPKPAVTNNTPLEFFLGGNVEPGFDFTLTTPSGAAASNTVYFAAGTALAQLRVTPTNDTVQASRPGFVTVVVTNYSSGLWDERMAIVNLIDNDPPTVSVTAFEPIAAEPAPGVTNNGIFRFTRAGSNTTAMSLSFSLSGNSTNGVDYNTIATTLNFPAGTNFLDVTVFAKSNNVFNGVRQVIATIPANAAYLIASGKGSASVMITESDLPVVQVIAADSDARETGPKAGKLALLRTGNTSSALTIAVGVSGSATSGVDYTALTNAYVIPAGTNRLEINVTPIADGLLESSETVVMTLKGSADYAIGVTNAATVFIDDSNATSFTWTQIKQASSYHTTPTIDSPGIVEIYRTGSCRVATNIPYQIYSNATLNMSYMRVLGNVTNNQIRFEANSNMARVFLTAATPGKTNNGGYLAISNLFMASSYPIHFLAADRYVQISILQTNAIEGTSTNAKLRAIRFATNSALSIPFTVLTNSTATATFYNLTNSGVLNLSATMKTNDYSISANADSVVQGWRSLVLSIPINDSTVAYQLPTNYLTFIRDNVTDPTGLPEPDTDNDGLSDLWELANGLDPLSPDDSNADPDRNGLGFLDEYQLGLNPIVSDPGPDYLPIRLRVHDTGKINNGNNCAVCHTHGNAGERLPSLRAQVWNGYGKSFLFPQRNELSGVAL